MKKTTTVKSKPVAPSPALTWHRHASGPWQSAYRATSEFAQYDAEETSQRGKPPCWWLRVQLTEKGGADPLIKRFTLDHYRTIRDAKAAAEIYDVGLAHRAEEKNR